VYRLQTVVASVWREGRQFQEKNILFLKRTFFFEKGRSFRCFFASICRFVCAFLSEVRSFPPPVRQLSGFHVLFPEFVIKIGSTFVLSPDSYIHFSKKNIDFNSSTPIRGDRW